MFRYTAICMTASAALGYLFGLSAGLGFINAIYAATGGFIVGCVLVQLHDSRGFETLFIVLYGWLAICVTGAVALSNLVLGWSSLAIAGLAVVAAFIGAVFALVLAAIAVGAEDDRRMEAEEYDTGGYALTS